MNEIPPPQFQLEKQNRLGNWVLVFTSESLKEVKEEIEVWVETNDIPRNELRVWRVERTLIKV